MSHDIQQLGNSEQMVLTKQLAEGKHTYYARGLRLINACFAFCVTVYMGAVG